MNDIRTPTLLVDKQKTLGNIRRMHKKATDNNLMLKPHFKTHQSTEIGRWFEAEGIKAITVSSIAMAEYFAAAGWNDITIAFPCNVREAERINRLAGSVKLSILISDPNTFPLLRDLISNPLEIYVEIDTGSNRTGFKANNIKEIESIVSSISTEKQFKLKGFYSHPGHSYSARSKQEIQLIHQTAVRKMQDLKNHFKPDYPNIQCCMGDTPCSSMGKDWTGIDEMSPGNFVFYDVMQHQVGSCKIDNIAVALACPVVAVYPERNEIVIHGGAVHLSKDSIKRNTHTIFGDVVRLNNDLRWNTPIKDCYVKSLSQEHGIIRCSTSFIKSITIGDIIGILPVHSCLAADSMQSYICSRSFTPLDHMKGNAIKK